MSRIIERALSIINDNLKDQTSSFADPISIKPMARGGRLLEDEYPTHYLPHVGRQVMADGGDADPVSGALDVAQSIPETPMPSLRPTPPAPKVPSAEGRVRARQTLASIIKRGQPISPRRPDPSPEELLAARNDTRMGGDIVGKRLDTIVPESARVAGGTYTPGAPGGGRWADMGDDVLNAPGIGFKFTPEQREAEAQLEDAKSAGDEEGIAAAQKKLDAEHSKGDSMLQKLWEDSVNESSAAARAAVEKHVVKPQFLAKDWDKAMRLPIRDHLWYELSGEKMGENMPDLEPHEFMKGMDLIGATSARAKPGENLERTLGVLSQHMRGVPADVDVTIPETVRQALARDHHESSALPGNKTGYFSDTLALTGGVPTRFPISVNDVWVGKMFGVPDDVMSGNQSLHEPMAIYFNKIRDMYNDLHPEKPFEYQSWNFQAPAWVHLRGEESKAESGDAYHQVWSGLLNKLKAAGVPGIEGDKIRREAFMHPGFADALRRTTAPFRESAKATIGFGTKQTPVGEQAHDIYNQAIEAGDEKSQKEYLTGLTKAMYASARGKHPWDSLKKAVTGNLGTDVTRISHPTSASPLDTGGSLESSVYPNIRVPLKDMSDDQIEHFNAIVGHHLKQDAIPASRVLNADPDDTPRNGYVRGFSAFVPTTESMNPDHIRDFARELSGKGHNMSYERYPNGYKFDVVPQLNNDGFKGIDEDDLADAYDKSLKEHYGEPNLLAHDFQSVYAPSSDYGRLRSRLIKGIEDDFIQQAVISGQSQSDARKALKGKSLPGSLTGRGKKAWNTYRTRLDHLSDAEKGFQDLAQRVNDSHTSFIDSASKRLSKTKPAKSYGGAIIPGPKLTEDNADDFARRLIAWSFATAPLFHRADGGAVEDPVATAVDTARQINPMGFYSAAAEAASKFPQRAPIDQIINKIKGQPNVKKEELDNANLANAFAGQRSVDPKEVARHLQASVPQIKERVYGGSPAVKYEPKALLERPKGFENTDDVYEVGPQGKPPHLIAVNGDNFDVWGPSGYHNSFDSFNDAVDYANQSIHGVEPTEYSQYTIPGGENYREIIMNIPVKSINKTEFSVSGVLPSKFDSREEAENYVEQLRQVAESNPALAKKLAKFPINITSQNVTINSKPIYKSSHWNGVDNPLAHLRMSDRDNGKTLHLEELQSDWGQAGREEGFYDPNREKTDPILTQMSRDVSSAVPKAPYVTSTDQWVDLGLKRALMEAAKGGYDKLIWTPGEEHADRYNLSKHVQALAYDPEEKTLSYLPHTDPNYRGYINIPGNVEPHEVKKHIGKEIAKRLLATEPHKLSGNHILEGLDLEVGKEGMQDFYDKLVPQRLNKLVAQYDKDVKIAPHSHSLQGKDGEVKAHSIQITPKMREAILKGGLPAFEHGGSVIEKAIGGGSFQGKKPPSIKNLAKVKDKFIYHSGTVHDLQSMKDYLEPQHGDWIREIAEHSGYDNPDELLEKSTPLIWMSDKPTWVVSKVARKLNKSHDKVTVNDIREHGHVAVIPRKGDHADHVWRVGEEGLQNGPYSEVTNLNGEKTKAYNTDLFDEDKEPFGVERNEYISAQSVEPLVHLTGNDLVSFLRETGDLPKDHLNKDQTFAGGGSVIDAALDVVSKLRR